MPEPEPDPILAERFQAALLHDSLEDHPDRVAREDLGARFGPRVREIVEACTDTPRDYAGGPKAPWKERKRAHLDHLLAAGRDDASAAAGAFRFALADELDNARSILAEHRKPGDALWGRFHAGKDDPIGSFRSLLEIFLFAGPRGETMKKSGTSNAVRGGRGAGDPIAAYAKAQPPEFRAICDRLREWIDAALPGATSKVWHGSPVWFLDENPVVGYAATAKAVQLLFWNGRALDEAGLEPVGKYRAAQAVFGAAAEMDPAAIRRWLKKAGSNVFDSKTYFRKLREGK